MIEAYGTYNWCNRQWKHQFSDREELAGFLEANDAVLFDSYEVRDEDHDDAATTDAEEPAEG